MQNVYSAYTKVIDGTTYFFVKEFLVFPELKNVPPILGKYAMHTDFDKACGIAYLHDTQIKKQLLAEMKSHSPLAKVIEIDNTNYIGKMASGN